MSRRHLSVYHGTTKTGVVVVYDQKPKSYLSLRKELNLKPKSIQSRIFWYLQEKGESPENIENLFLKLREAVNMTDGQLNSLLSYIKGDGSTLIGAVEKIKNKDFELEVVANKNKNNISEIDIPHDDDRTIDEFFYIFIKFCSEAINKDYDEIFSIMNDGRYKINFYNVYFKPNPSSIDDDILALIELFCYLSGYFNYDGIIYSWHNNKKIYCETIHSIMQDFNSFWSNFIIKCNYSEDKSISQKMRDRANDIFAKIVTNFTKKATLVKIRKDYLLNSVLLRQEDDLLNRNSPLCFPILKGLILRFVNNEDLKDHKVIVEERTSTDLFTKYCDVNYNLDSHTEYQRLHPKVIWDQKDIPQNSREKMRKFISDFCFDPDTDKHIRKVKLLKYALGSSILGEPGRIVIFLGKTAGNGKTTLMKIMNETIGKKFSGSFEMSTLCYEQKDPNNTSDSLSSLYPLRTAFIYDTGKTIILNENVVKKIASEGDRIRARNLYKSSFEFNSQATFYINSNHLIDISKWENKTLDAMKRRFLYIVCNSKFRFPYQMIDRKDFKTDEEFYTKLYQDKEDNVDINDPYVFECKSFSVIDQSIKDAFFELIVEGAILYLNKDFTIEQENNIYQIENSLESVNQVEQDLLRNFIEDTFTITGLKADKILINDMLDSLKKYAVEHDSYNWETIGIIIENNRNVNLNNGNGDRTRKLIAKFKCINTNVKYNKTNTRKIHFEGLRYSTRDENINTSKGEMICKQSLETIFGLPFKNTRPDFLKNPETNQNLELDCYNEDLKIAVEYNGYQHYIWPNKFHQNIQQFEKQLNHDKLKSELCKKYGIHLIEVPHNIPLQDIHSFILQKLP